MKSEQKRQPYCRGLQERPAGFPLRLTVARRFLQGWTQRELARRVGCSHGTVSAFEGGRAQPSAELLERLCSVLVVSMDWLWTGATCPWSSTDRADQLYREELRFRDPGQAGRALADVAAEIRAPDEFPPQ